MWRFDCSLKTARNCLFSFHGTKQSTSSLFLFFQASVLISKGKEEIASAGDRVSITGFLLLVTIRA